MRQLLPASLRGTLLILFLCSACSPSHSPEEKIDPADISKITGFQGTTNQAAGVFKINLTRHDLNVAIDGVKVSPGMGLMAWASFTGTKPHAVLIGEVVLREDEVNGFLSQAIEAGLNVTSLHNTFLWDSPRVLSLHFSGTGSEAGLASSVGMLFKNSSPARSPLKNHVR